jgi:DNA-binding MarR family transcriptional regulator
MMPAAMETAAESGRLDQGALMHLVGYAATRASVELKKTFGKHLGPLKLKAVEFSILTLVDTNPEVNQKQLGQALDVSAPNLAVTLDRMVEQGWVRRERSERDRRAQLVRLTPAGQALVTRARKIAQTMEHEALKVLSPAEQALLIELLHRVSQRRPRG